MTTTTGLDKALDEETKKTVQTVLDGLITLNRDAVEGYKLAAQQLDNEHYQQICRKNAEQRKQFISELVHMVNQYDGVPTDAQSVAGVLHDAWISIKNMVTNDDAAVIAECDRGEEVAVTLYHSALDEDIPADVETLLRTQFALLKGSHERMQRLSAALAT